MKKKINSNIVFKPRKKGIFCMEGLWNHHNIMEKPTVLPILELLQKCGYFDFIYHDCATVSEFEFFLDRWKVKKTNSKYPILYLAFHGDKGLISLPKNVHYSLEELSVYLKDKCEGKIIYFGSCSTLNIDKEKVKSFLDSTGAVAFIGYKKDIYWMQSAACDLFVFDALQNNDLDKEGIRHIRKKIMSNYGNLNKKLGLTIITNDR